MTTAAARIAWFTWFALIFAMALWGCGSSGDGCEAEGDCPDGFRCQVETGSCVCATDEVCPDGFECNSVGVCQARVGCARNSDCEDGTFCDIRSGSCVQGPAAELSAPCSLASQCAPGSICQGGACVQGCVDSGDCALGDVCFEGVCSQERGRCEDASYCAYGGLCADGFCRQDFRGPYCRACTPGGTPQNPEPCDAPKNFCLNNSVELGGQTAFCGVDCSNGQDCPNGYSCFGVVRLTGQPCRGSAQCQCRVPLVPTGIACELTEVCRPLLPDGSPDPNATACLVEGIPACGDALCQVPVNSRTGVCQCASDDQCPGDAACVSGGCCPGATSPERRCSLDEGDIEGFCTCSQDSDCQQNVCSAGTCSETGDPCTPGEEPCPPVRCENGGCVIGRNCAPSPGLACSVLRP